MNFSLVDAGGLAVSVLSYGPLLVLPGLGLAALSGVLGFADAPDDRRMETGLVVGLGLLPVLDALATRFTSLDGAVALNLVFAGAAASLAWRRGWRLRPSAWSLALLCAWFAILCVEWIDFDVAGRLYQPFVVMDMVKHAATVQAIHDTGAPPLDPFFLRPERVSYYYFFYTLAALSLRICGGLIDARAAVGGLAFWVGIGLYGLVRLLLRRSGLGGQADAGRQRRLLLVLLATGGLDLVFVIWRGWRDGTWLPDPAAWNEQVTSWFESILWVPHHVTGLIALFVGFAATVDALEAFPIGWTNSLPWHAMQPARRAGPVLVAGGCFASALGLSIWVTLAGVVTACVWFAVLMIERRGRALGVLAAVGLVAMILALPQLRDLHAGRSDGIPIAFTVRAFMPVDDYVAPGVWRMALRLLCLPVNYGAEFGVLAAGTLLFWWDRKRFGFGAGGAPGADGATNELARVLAIGALTGLALGTFFQSLLFNNDLGWRVMLLPSLAALVWTIAALERRRHAAPIERWRAIALVIPACAAIGLATTLYAAIALRAFYAMPITPMSPVPVAGRDTQHALRLAYEWANRTLPRQSVLQHNPLDLDHPGRALAFGLYSTHRVAVGDHFGSLFGADFDAVAARLQAIQPIFKEARGAAEVAALARGQHIDALVVTADDPAWQAHAAWIRDARPLYASALVRIIPVAGLGRGDVADAGDTRQRVGSLP